MIYYLQTLSLKTRFMGVLLLLFPVVGFWWLETGAPWALAELQVLSGGAGLPDQLFWYTPAQLQALFDRWGDPGRWHYLAVLWPTDAGLALAYAAFFAAALLYLLKKANPAGPWWNLMPLVPLAAGAADLLEDATVVAASWLPAEGWDPVAWLAAGFTAAKWGLLALTLGLVAGGTLLVWLRRAWQAWKGLAGSD